MTEENTCTAAHISYIINKRQKIEEKVENALRI